MEDNKTVDNDYLKSFNQGYIFNQLEPSLAQEISKSMGESNRAQGFKDGMDLWDKNKGDILKTAEDKNAWADNKKDITQPSNTTKPYLPKFLRDNRFDNPGRQEPEKDYDKDKD